jgi:predicted metalloprotease
VRQRARAFVALGAVLAATLVTTGTAPAATRPATASFQSLVNAAVTDLQSYWAKEFPQLYGHPYKPVGQIIAASPTTKLPDCQGQAISYQKVKGNAFYCFGSNYLAYDSQTLLPTLGKDFGSFAPALVLAHEWGHAIQDRAGIDPSQYPTIYIEQQADCFAGTWARHVADGDSKTVKFAPGDLDTALAAYLSFRDPVGFAPDTPQSHGDAFDRVNAFQTGYEKGATACTSFLTSPPPITEQQFTNLQDAASGGNLPANQVVPVTMELLDEYYRQVAPDVPPLTLDQVKKVDTTGPASSYPKCGGKTLTKAEIQNRVFLCPTDNFIAYDQALFNTIYTKIGDFGFASLVGDAYATYVQYREHVPGVQSHSESTALAADCDTGVWAQAIAQGLNSPTLGNTTVTLAPGDLDKVIRAFITNNAAAGPSTKSDFVFRRVEAFRLGFFGNFASCATTFGNSSTSTSST